MAQQIAPLEQRNAFRAKWPDEYDDGARQAFFGQCEGRTDGYPPGFSQWPLDRRNAWFAGFNAGLCDGRSLYNKKGNE